MEGASKDLGNAVGQGLAGVIFQYPLLTLLLCSALVGLGIGLFFLVRYKVAVRKLQTDNTSEALRDALKTINTLVVAQMKNLPKNRRRKK